MPSTATITAKAGAGVTVTAQALTGVQYFSLDTSVSILTIKCDQGLLQYSVNSSTTFTLTKSGSNYALTVS